MSYSHAASLRQQAKWIREALDNTTPETQRVTLDDIDVEALESAADYIDILSEALEVIAGSSKDKLRAMQAKAALDNIGAKA